MTHWPPPPHPYGPLLAEERDRLLQLLGGLDPADWARPTPCPGWNVHDLVLHLVGDDLSGVSFLREGHRGAAPPPGGGEAGFVAWLDRLQDDWVVAARRISPRLSVEMLRWLDGSMIATIDAQDPSALTAEVSWASDQPAPVWLDHARELSEYWIHRQQLLQALGRPSDLRADLCAPVLDGLRWAYPYRLAAVPRPAGSVVTVDVTGPEVAARWVLVSDGTGWTFTSSSPGTEGSPLASLRVSTDAAWRLLTNNLPAADRSALDTNGDPEVVAVLLRTRAIIGEPQ